MNANHPSYKSKTAATWIALIGGGAGLHRFYLHGWRDAWGWAFPLPALLGLYGIARVREFGQDDQLSWILIPLLGFALATAMLMAIIYALTPDETWNARYNAATRPTHSGWAVIIGAALALMLGAMVLLSAIAFSGQRYFEYQIDEAHKISQ